MVFSDIRVKEINGIIHYTPQTMKFSAKNRNNHIVGIQLSGRAEHFFADHQFTLEENCLYFFNQEEDYNVEIKEKGICFSVHFTTFAPVKAKSFHIKIKDSGAIVRMLQSIEQAFSDTGECGTKVLGELYRLFSCFEEVCSRNYSLQDSKILQAKEYMNLHFKEKDCIAKAAEEYGVTLRRFNDIFKNNFQTTPNQYIINHKINLAQKLLYSKELSIGDVSDLCGFEDIYYFSKTFKKVTGQTASAFRKQT